MNFHKIIINNEKRKIKIYRKYLIDQNDDGQNIYIPDQVGIKNNVEINDPILNGTSILFPNFSNFPQDLIHFRGDKFKFQLTDGSQITGFFLEFDQENGNSSNELIEVVPENKTKTAATFGVATAPTVTPQKNNLSKRIIIESLECYSEKLQKELPKGYISVATSHVQSYFPLEENYHTKRLPHIIINDYTPREIIISYDVPFTSDSFESAYFSHSIKGIDCKALYSDPNLESNIPITFRTIYYWVPRWDIQDDNVTLLLITPDGKETYTIKNFKCIKNYLTQITVNQFESNATRAVLVFPLGGIRISLYFQNNSEYVLSNHHSNKIIFENNDHNNISNSKKSSSVRSLFNNPQTQTLFKEVYPNTMGVISFDFDNRDIQIYKDIACEPLWDTRVREFNIVNIKLSNIFTLMDTETRSKILFQFVNATDHKTKYIVYIGNGDINSNQDPESLNNKITANGKEIASSLYLFDSSPLSINNFQITHSQKKTFMTHNKLPQVLINYLIEKGIQIKYNANKFETYDLSKLDRNTQDTIIKLMSTSLFLEEKKSNYFNRPIQNSNNISQSLFSESNFNKSPTSFSNTGGLFGSSVQSYNDRPQVGGFGSNTNGFGTAPQQNVFNFGANTQPQQPSAFGFGSAQLQQQQLQQQQQQQPSTFAFGSTQPQKPSPFGGTNPQPQQLSPFGGTNPQPQQPSPFGFGSSQPQQPSSFGFGSANAQPQQPSSFGFTTIQPSAQPTQAPVSSNQPNSNDDSDTDSISSFVSINNSPKLLGQQNPTPTTPTPTSVTFVDGIGLTSITAKPEFSNKSFEEIREEDTEKKQNAEKKE